MTIREFIFELQRFEQTAEVFVEESTEDDIIKAYPPRIYFNALTARYMVVIRPDMRREPVR